MENPDGTEVEVEPLQAALMLRKWADVFAGLWVYEKTKL